MVIPQPSAQHRPLENAAGLPSAEELRAAIARRLSDTAGGDEGRWADLAGAVEVLPIALNPACNWRVTPDGSWGEVEVIWRAVEHVRVLHPHARP